MGVDVAEDSFCDMFMEGGFVAEGDEVGKE